MPVFRLTKSIPRVKRFISDVDAPSPLEMPLLVGAPLVARLFLPEKYSLFRWPGTLNVSDVIIRLCLQRARVCERFNFFHDMPRFLLPNLTDETRFNPRRPYRR